jgi:hypothetical protein
MSPHRVKNVTHNSDGDGLSWKQARSIANEWKQEEGEEARWLTPLVAECGDCTIYIEDLGTVNPGKTEYRA